MSILLHVFSGIIVGIIINYFSDVLPATRSLSIPSCKNCAIEYSPLEYLLLKRCPKCDSKRTVRAFMVMVFSILANILLKYFPIPQIGFFASLPILIYLGVIIIVDIEHRLVLIQTSVVGLLLFFIYGIIINGFFATIFGGLISLILMLFLFFGGKLLLYMGGKFRGKTIKGVAFGLGDVFFGTILGLLVGDSAVIGSNLITMLVMVLFSFFLFNYLVLKGKYRAYTATLPFTTFQAIGAVAVLYVDLMPWAL